METLHNTRPITLGFSHHAYGDDERGLIKIVLDYMCTRSAEMPTSKRTASQAGRDLRDPKTPKKDRAPIASDLAQAPRKPKKKR